MAESESGLFARGGSDSDPATQDADTREPWPDLQSEHRILRACLQCLGSAVFSVDGQYRYTSFNGVHASIMKAIYGAEIELGRSFLDYLTVEEDQATAKFNLDRALGGEVMIEKASAENIRMPRPFFEFTHHPIRNSEGKCVGVVVIAGDILQRNRDLDTLAENERRFEALFEQAGVGIVEVDSTTGRFLQVNPRYCDIVGYSQEVLLRSDLQIITHPEDLTASRDLMAGLAEGRFQKRTIEKRYIRKDGEIVWVSIQAAKMILGNGPSGTHISIVQDITARKQAEEKLKESEALHHSLFENMLNGFALCRMLYDDQNQPQDFLYLEVNSAFELLTGLRDVVGKKVSEVIPGIREADPGLFESYGRVALTGQPERFENYVAALGMWFSISVYCPREGHFVAVFDVITKRKRAEEAIKNQLEELRRWHEATLGRESRVLELKREVNELLVRHGQHPRYSSACDAAADEPPAGMAT